MSVSTNYVHLSQLGSNTTLPLSADETVLETDLNPRFGIDYVVRCAQPEFSSLCPLTSQPVFAHLATDSILSAVLIVSKSLKLFLDSFRNQGDFHEDCTIGIAKHLEKVLNPVRLRIGRCWYPRGGMPLDVFFQTVVVPKGVWLSEQGVPTYRGRG